MNKLKLAYLLLIASAILLIINIYNLDFKNLQNGNYWGIASNLLLMIGIIINIRDLKNREENKQKMEKDKILNFLNKYNYNYSEKNNSIFVKLELAQQVKIEFDEPNKIIIKDKLIGWNFLTGTIEMTLKNALIYNFIWTIILGILCMYSENKENGLNFIALFLVSITWIILFSVFYIVKLESFKNQIINWTK